MLPQVMRLLGDSDASVRAKALLALSSLLRGNGAGLDQFREQDGLRLLERATQDPDARVRRWAAQVVFEWGARTGALCPPCRVCRFWIGYDQRIVDV